MVYDNKPAYDNDLEQAIISAILLDKQAMKVIADILEPADFYYPANAEIFAGMMQINQDGREIDFVTLKRILIERGSFDSIGGSDYLLTITGHVSTSVFIKQHTEELKRLSESRRITKLITDLINKPELLTVEDLDDSLNKAKEKRYIKSYADKAMESLTQYKLTLREKKERVYTGLKALDNITGGIRKPSVFMIGAYPSVGKTAFALNIAAYQETPVAFFSLEMSNDMIYERMAAADLKIDYSEFMLQKLSESQYNAVEAYTGILSEKKFYVFDDIYFVEQQANIIADIKPQLVVVDYIQKVKTHRKNDGRRHEIDYISGMYKQIAKQNNCVVLLLSQLSRGAGNNNPTMSSLKESGALEADGDYIGILHRPYVLNKENPEENRPEDGYILLDKNKFGNTGLKKLYFSGKYQRFYETYDDSVKHRPKQVKDKLSIADIGEETGEVMPWEE